MTRLEPDILYAEYEDLFEKGELFSALARLGRLAFVLSRDSPDNGVYESRMQAVSLSPGDMERLRSSAEETIERLRKILSAGGQYTFEELAWIITLRVEFWLVENFVTTYRKMNLGVSTRAVDQELDDLKDDPACAGSLLAADRHVKKHGGIGLVDIR